MLNYTPFISVLGIMHPGFLDGMTKYVEKVIKR